MSVVVFGSCNMDLTIRVSKLPKVGQTIVGKSLRKYPGGKGANQAVAAARLGARCYLYCILGDDDPGLELRSFLQNECIGVEGIEVRDNKKTGQAIILVDDDGYNMIVYLPGANSLVDETYAKKALKRIQTADVLLLQLELPLSVVSYVLHHVPSDKPHVILDPSPAQDLNYLPVSRVDIITPNQQELLMLTGEKDYRKAAGCLLDLGVKTVICKAGSEGAYLAKKNIWKHIPSFHVDAIDTTACGDAFNGALAVALAEGQPIEDAILFANAAGALAATKQGAQPSLPYRRELNMFLEKQHRLWKQARK